MIKKTILYVFTVFALLAILFYNTETNEKIKDILSKVNTMDQEMSRAGAKEKGLAEDQWSFDARIVTEKIMKDVRKLNRKIKPLPVLLTKYISSSSQSVQMKKAALKAFKSSIVKTPITYSTVVAKSHSKRQSIHESSPNHQIAQEYDKVAESISSFINKKKK
jgi:cellulose biosynthesis protein BcsQ